MSDVGTVLSVSAFPKVFSPATLYFYARILIQLCMCFCVCCTTIVVNLIPAILLKACVCVNLAHQQCLRRWIMCVCACVCARVSLHPLPPPLSSPQRDYPDEMPQRLLQELMYREMLAVREEVKRKAADNIPASAKLRPGK